MPLGENILTTVSIISQVTFRQSKLGELQSIVDQLEIWGVQGVPVRRFKNFISNWIGDIGSHPLPKGRFAHVPIRIPESE